MDHGEIRQLRLEQANDAIAMERRHIAQMTEHLERARELGWEQGVRQAEDLLRHSHITIARLEAEIDALMKPQP